MLFCSEAQKVDVADVQQHEDEPEEERPVYSVPVSKHGISMLQLSSRRYILPVEPELLRGIDVRNFHGWHSSFTPSEMLCELCGHSLEAPLNDVAVIAWPSWSLDLVFHLSKWK